MRDEYTDWDAAYVLGALSSAERREYEDHVDGCARCAAAVAELGMLPGLLRLVPDEDAPAYLRPEPRVPDPVPVRVVDRRRLPAKALAAAAVVLLVAAVGVGVVVTRADRPSGETVALGSVVASPLQAAVHLTPQSWGTEISMTCTYSGEYGTPQRYALYVVDRTGHRQLVSRWWAGPGETALTTGATDLATRDIGRIELRSADGTLLLARAL
ncbi:MAG TPA: zf-HC2 domain-containing protein [Nocardioides sp.]|nr:zf-HC2 domain-containing protein [Nocardioides sp.]